MSIHLGGRGPGHIARVQGVGNPASILGANLKVWFDVQDLSTMWQDTAATTPAAVGQVVRRIYCKANPAFYAEQSNATQEPILRQTAVGVYYLETDGSNDGMVTPSLNLSATDKLGVFTAVRKLSDAAAGMVVEFSATVSSNAGSFFLAAPAAANASYGFASKGSSQATASLVNASLAAPNSAVLTGLADISGDSVVARRNGAQLASSSSDQGSGNFGNHALYLFRRGGTTLPFNGHFYGLTLCAATPTAWQVAAMETYYNSLARAY